jgi:hypothetical protein
LPGTETCERPGSPTGPLGGREKLAALPPAAPAFHLEEAIWVRFTLMLLYRLTLTLAYPPPHAGLAKPHRPPTMAALVANASPVASAVPK